MRGWKFEEDAVEARVEGKPIESAGGMEHQESVAAAGAKVHYSLAHEGISKDVKVTAKEQHAKVRASLKLVGHFFAHARKRAGAALKARGSRSSPVYTKDL